MGEILRAVGIDYGCARVYGPAASGWGQHHRVKKSAGGSDDPRNLLWSCPICNEAIESYPAEVREATGSLLVVRPGDPEWDKLRAKKWSALDGRYGDGEGT